MAELNIFHYLPKESVIHNLDGRMKLICAILFTAAISSATKLFDLMVMSFVLLVVLVFSRLPVKKLLSEVRYFLFLIGMVVVVHSWSVPGTPIFYLPFSSFTWEGLNSGLFFGWRLVLIVILCSIFTGTTSLLTLKNVVEWFLRPIPFVPETSIATMFSLTFVLIPLLFDQASEILDAQKARCVEGRKNPVSRIVSLVFPLFLHTFRRADEIVFAMESRCYSEVRTKAVFQTKISDWLLLIFAGLIFLLVFFKFCSQS